ncbi:EthD domain-containing protein [Frankia sp. CNm7]|uniref:EthD domain-containing protein n=1 Tax=Frankia nepalensis TaxID=1836974 RepID=A0A937UPU5_9ACTN|nr:EthD domain-containing protein [Frankia nepalensis]MBL7502823.1 EthD domain-containing protein [Frankia nepalensis]MBL7515101.1 EthD domain-containing protein [Frankia nepalensis]MBL7518828.1 EthD domain-containing protein [Frankia nepalensis]MBL7625951.1 EthD domain-containing protein [Frankia nepalensis]
MSGGAAPSDASAGGDPALAGADGPPAGEILLFLFTRKAGLSEDQFRDHYLNVHAPMALAHSTAKRRYIVRLVEGGHEPLPLAVDALTEIWTESWDAFVDPAKGWDSVENWKLVIDDAANFLDGFHMYKVSRETLVPAGADPAGQPPPAARRGAGERSAGVVLARLFLTGEEAEEAADEAGGPDAIGGTVRYRVLETLSPGAPPLHAVDLVWLPDATAARYRPRTYVLGEYVQKWL